MAQRNPEATNAIHDAERLKLLLAFLLSFVIIATFWVGHERLFHHVAGWTAPVMVLNIAWMLCIVFLPVATAMAGSMETDRPQLVLYVGTMLLGSLVMAGVAVTVRRDRRLWRTETGPPIGSVTAQGVLVVLFGLALALALAVPSLGYLPLFLLFLTAPLQRAARRRWSR